MNKLFILLLLFATNSFGQTTNDKTGGILINSAKTPESDTALRVIYVDREKTDRPSAIFINGKFVMNEAFSSLDPKWIEKIDVVKGDTLIDNIAYNGQIHIKTKSDYVPKIISLTDLKKKYTDFKGKPVVFMIDGNFVNANYDNYLVDENNLLTIIVDKIQTDKEKIDLGLIKLLTKSEENIKKRKQIIIRGTEVSINK